MTKTLYLKGLLTIIVLISISLIFVKFSYPMVDSRLQSKLFFKEDPFVVGGYSEQYFKFNQTVLNIITNIRNRSDNTCNFSDIGKLENVIPITVKEKRGTFNVEIINPIKSDNNDCFDHVLKMVKLEFSKHIKRRMDKINLQKTLRINALEELNSKEITLKSKTYINEKLSFSDFLELLDNDQILEVGISQDFITGEKINGEKFYSITKNLSNSDFIIKKFYEKNLNFYFVQEDYSKNKVYREYFNQENIEDKVNLTYFNNKLNQSPYIVTSITHKKIKISKYVYTSIIIILFNFVGLIIFMILNKKYFKSILKFIKKIA